MSDFKATRAALSYINYQRLPRGLFKRLVEAVGVTDEPVGHEAWRVAEQALIDGIQDAMQEKVESYRRPPPARRRGFARGRLGSADRLVFEAPGQPHIELISSAVSSKAIDMQLSGATADDVESVWSSALWSLNLEQAKAPKITGGEHQVGGSGIVILHIKLGLPGGCVASVDAPVLTGFPGPLTDGVDGFAIIRGYQTLGAEKFREPKFSPNSWTTRRDLAKGLLDPENRASTAAAGELLARIPTDGSNALGLYLLEAWYAQRDYWVRNEALLPDGSVVPTPEKRVIVLDPKAMHDRAFPGERRVGNWRRKQWFRVLAARCAERKTSDGSWHGLLGDAVDGRHLAEYEASVSPAIVAALREAGLESVDAFFVTLTPEFASELGPHHIDAHGKLHWWHAALARCKAEAKGNRSSAAAKVLPGIKEGMDRLSYVSIDPNMLIVANAFDWTDHQTQIALTVMGEKTRRTGGRPRRVKEKAPLPPAKAVEEGLASYNGSSGHGYRLSIWMDRAVSELVRVQPNLALTTRHFLSNLAFLHTEIGLEVRAGDAKSTTDLLYDLSANTTKRQQPLNQVLRMFLPTELEARLEARLAEAGIEAARGLAVRPDPLASAGARLRATRRRRGLTQDAVGQMFGVSKVVVSGWENGKRKIPAKHLLRLEEWLLVDVA